MVPQGVLHWIPPRVLGLQGRIATQHLTARALELPGRAAPSALPCHGAAYLAFVPKSVVTVCPVDWTVNVISYVAVLSLSEPVFRL